MSGIGFPSDTSTQTISSITPIGTYNPIINSNSLYISLNAKQDTLTAATTLLGVGSAITALDYNKITLNKPSVFPADMTNIYSKTETNNLLSAKQDTLTAATSLLGVGSAITALDYNKITLNKPLVFPADMTNIYSKTETNNLLNAKQDTLTAATSLLGVGSAITALDYNKITLNKPSVFPADMTNIYSKTEVNNISVLINYPNYTVLNSCNYTTNTTTGLINYPTYTVLNSCNYITNSITNRFSILTGTFGVPTNGTTGGSGDRIILWSGSGTAPPYSIGIDTATMWYSTPALTSHKFYIGNSVIFSFNTTTGGIFTGTLNSTVALQEAGVSLNNKYSSYTALNSCNYITNTTTGLINYPNYTVLNSCNYITNTTSGLINYPNYTVLNSCNYLTTASLATTYLKLDGTNSMTGALSVGTTTSKQQLTIQAATPAMIRVQTNTDTTNQISGIEFGIPAYTSVLCAKITSTTEAGNANDIKFYTNATSGTASTERLRINNNGNVNIGNANNINCRLYVNSGITTVGTCFPLRICAGAAADTNANATIFGLGTEANGWSKSGIAHVRTAGYDQGDIVFLNRNTLDNADCSLAYERMRIYSGGGVNINQGLTVGGVLNIPVNTWHKSSDTVDRMYYDNNGITYFHSGNGGFIFRDSGNSINNLVINNNAAININNNGTINFDNNLNNFKINMWGGVYGFGIQGSTLLYTSAGVHRFMTGGNETLKINTNGYITGAQNVCKRAVFSFTPLFTNFPTTYYSYYINVNNYISSLATFTTVYAYRITIWTDSGDFGDMSVNCDTLQYVFFQSDYAGGKKRWYQIFNNTTTNYIECYSSPTQIYFHGGTNGSKRWCVIENIAGY